MNDFLHGLGRALAILTLAVGIPAGTAAAVTHAMLDGTEWTDPKPTVTAPPKTAPARTEATPAPKPKPKPRPASSVWPLGTCVTPTTTRTPCTTPGALQIVASIHDPDPDVCRDVPETDHVRHTGTYALCLTTS